MLPDCQFSLCEPLWLQLVASVSLLIATILLTFGTLRLILSHLACLTVIQGEMLSLLQLDMPNVLFILMEDLSFLGWRQNRRRLGMGIGVCHGILVEDVLHLCMLWNICLMVQICVAFFF